MKQEVGLKIYAINDCNIYAKVTIFFVEIREHLKQVKRVFLKSPEILKKTPTIKYCLLSVSCI